MYTGEVADDEEGLCSALIESLPSYIRLLMSIRLRMSTARECEGKTLNSVLAPRISTLIRIIVLLPQKG